MGQNIGKTRPGSCWGIMLRGNSTRAFAWVFSAVLCVSGSFCAKADDLGASPEAWSLHGQFTVVEQYHPGFHSPYRGVNSLDPGSRGNEGVVATLDLGLRLWDGGQLHADPEVDQGFGISNTFGVAAFPDGEASKVGVAKPYARVPQVFFRQVVDLGGDQQAVEPGANQLGMTQSADNIVLTLGKFSVTDMFDTNAYAH